MLLIPIGIEDTFPVEKDIHSFSSDELIDGNSSTDDEIYPQKGEVSVKADVESMSSDSLIGDVESIDEDIHEEKGIYLLQKDMSSKNYCDGTRSKNTAIYNETVTPNTDLELQASNKLTEGIRSIGLKPLKLDQRGASHSAWSLQPPSSHRSSLQSPLKPKLVDFWQQKDKINQSARSNFYVRFVFVVKEQEKDFVDFDRSQGLFSTK